MTRSSRGLLLGLGTLVLLRLALHALFNPVYEGPDEPFHLARARQVVERPFADVLRGDRVDPEVVRSIRAWPCGPSLNAAFGCPTFGGEPAAFNILGPARAAGAGGPQENYQAHQPPIYYLAAGSLLKVFSLAKVGAPEAQLLLLRLVSVFLVGIALLLPVRRLGKENPLSETILLLALLLPGAAESLVRVANDVGIFAWSALLVSLVFRRDAFKPGLIACLSALGPLLKLTALPVVAVAAITGWRTRGWRCGLLVAIAGLTFLPVQWLRGWAWGGTLEANVPLSASESFQMILVGLAHSAYTFLKTSVWLGGWAVFRPPTWLLVAAPLFALLLAIRAFRFKPRIENWPAHAAGVAVAALGFIVFAVGKHKLFGVWGAVGGWYAWGWAPWLALLAADSVELRAGRGQEAILGALLGATLLNLVWFEVAFRTYG